MALYQLQIYQTTDEKQPFNRWLERLADRHARARIRTRLDRLTLGNFGDNRALEGGIFELRIDWGAGYRIYVARVGKVILLLLCGGDKKTQSKDIENAKAYLQDYLKRTEKIRTGRRPV
jgi:putative addiction module killer protein